MKRLLILCLLGSPPLSSLAFEVPDAAERRAAVGSLAAMTPKLAATFSSGAPFEPIAKPEPFDWLSSRKEEGQTYHQFLRSRPNRPMAQGRRFIYLVPIGKFPEAAPQSAALKEYVEAFFTPMTVKLTKPLSLDGAKVRTRGEQINCTDVLDHLQSRIPQDAYIVMSFTMSDLYPSDEWNFVFGMARIRKRCGIFSFARYGVEEDPKLALKRAFKVIVHETGHAFGIRHCTHFHCLMNGSNGLGETDRAPMHFCPCCLRKLHWGLKFDPVARYRKLQDSLISNGLPKEAQWFQSRADRLTHLR